MIVLGPEIAKALRNGQPVVALESTLIAHGLPWPINLETARAAEAAVRESGAIPATIAVLKGRPTIGIADSEIEALACGSGVMKASRRDLAVAIGLKKTAATTVAATMALAHEAGIRVLATGGIGGVHRQLGQGIEKQEGIAAENQEISFVAGNWDISADLIELARNPVAVVCSGAKNILDVPRTLEVLESLSVPVLGYGIGTFPAFVLYSSQQPISSRVDSPSEAAAVINAHWRLGGAGVVVAQPIPVEAALEASEWEPALAQAEKLTMERQIGGKTLTPFLLRALADMTQGKTIRANQALIISNARLAGQIAGLLKLQPRLLVGERTL